MLVENLEVFKLSHKLTLDIYEITSKFPNNEKWNLIIQMRKAAVSIPANLLEGAGRLSRKEYGRFILISTSSSSELLYYIFLSKDLKLISTEQHDYLSKETKKVRKMLFGLLKKTRKI